ncbi:MAG: M48 family metalloprotease [Bacteroidetes bacterium]|nr:M48 family metalloprotease [Bacteroidota bacterium]MCW5894453.1 M48 family metalloprotease [Bacteroidota bacterium]
MSHSSFYKKPHPPVVNYILNTAKLVLLGGISLLIFYAIGYAVAAQEGAWLAVIVWGSLVAALYGLADKMVVKMCRAELLTVYHNPVLFKIVGEVFTQTNLPMPKIYMTPEDAPNAGSVGFKAKKAGLLFTDGAAKLLNNDELRCTVAHQIIQLRRGDTAVGMVVAVLAMMMGMTSRFAREKAAANDSGSRKGGFLRFGFRGAMVFLAPLAAYSTRVVLNMKRFYAIDTAASRAGNPHDMANVIRTMEKKKHLFPTLLPPAVGHLFVVSPVRSIPVLSLFKSHPPMEVRIQRLAALQRATQGFRSMQSSQ